MRRESLSAAAAPRKTIAALWAEILHGDVRAGLVLPFGLDAIDDRLTGGGLAAHAVHEVCSGNIGFER